MPPKMKFEQIDEHGSMVHSVISCSLSFHGKGCCDPSTIGDYTLSFNGLYFLSCTVGGDTRSDVPVGFALACLGQDGGPQVGLFEFQRNAHLPQLHLHRFDQGNE